MNKLSRFFSAALLLYIVVRHGDTSLLQIDLNLVIASSFAILILTNKESKS